MRVQNPEAGTQEKEQALSKKLKQDLRSVLRGKLATGKKEDVLVQHLKLGLEGLGRFYRTEKGQRPFFRDSNGKLYEVTGESNSPFGRLVTYFTDLSVTDALMRRCLDRLVAYVAEEAELVQIHGLAYNSPNSEIIALNDFSGGMWYRRRGGSWERKPNGSEGILFWTPPDLVEPWAPEFSTDPAVRDEDHLTWFLEQPHFADDVLTIRDQRLLLRALLLAPFFPSLNRTRPVQAHLGLSQQRQHDTGKTTAGKMLGILLVGRKFEPMSADPSPTRGEEAVQLALMHQPFVLLDNVDTDITWLNDFLCTYATGVRPARRKLYTDTDMAHIEPRGRLAVTSRKAKFNRPDTASRVIPFRFKPILPTERKPDYALLDAVMCRRRDIWAGLLAVVARVQDDLPFLTPPSPSLRLAEFEVFGWRVAAIFGQEREWETAMDRLGRAQAGFALEDEPLRAILGELLKAGDLPEQPTSEFYTQVRHTAGQLALDWEVPANASALTKRVNQLRDPLESQLNVTIHTRTLHGQTLIRITRGASREVTGVTEVSEDSLFFESMGVGNEK